MEQANDVRSQELRALLDMPQPTIDVYKRGIGWDVFNTCPGRFEIERWDGNCDDDGPNYMDDDTAEWLVLFLAEDGDQDAQDALYPPPGDDGVTHSRYGEDA